MKSFEAPARRSISEESSRSEERREFHFRATIQSHLLHTFREALEDAEFPDEDIERIAVALAELPEEDARQVLALPLEIRNKFLLRYRDQNLQPGEIIKDILEKNQKYGYNLGYHLSNHPVPKVVRKDGSFEWNIRGSELDDRDDMRMAYYSEDYLNRYKKSAGRYLYVVRAELRENSSHKRDLKNHWGRAPFLSVIDEYDLEDIEHEIDDAIKKEDVTAGKAITSSEPVT